MKSLLSFRGKYTKNIVKRNYSYYQNHCVSLILQSDIWSFGCCCYEMVALQKAFGNESLFALCKKVCSDEVLYLIYSYILTTLKIGIIS
jgi:serine/threonine protein kinase